MLDSFFAAILILNATGLFRFLAPQFGVTIGAISLALLFLNFCYLLLRAPYSVPLLLRREMAAWIFLLLIWPLLTLSYASSIELREIGLLLYYFSLFFGTVVFTLVNGLPSMYRVLYVSLVVTILGLALSMLKPQYFEAVAILATARLEEMGRPLGFFMQPNRLAIATAFMFIGWFSLWPRKNTVLEIIPILAFLLMTLITGSRTAMLISALIVTLILGHSWTKRILSGRYILRMGLLAACSIAGVVGVDQYLSTVGRSMERREEDLVDRMQTLLQFKLTHAGSVTEDTSVRERFNAQQVYWKLIKEKPILGHGLGAEVHYEENGKIFLSSHSSALTSAMEYGAFYPFVFFLLVVNLFFKRGRREAEQVFHTNSILQFISVLLPLFLINGGFLETRTFYVVLGMFFAALNYPQDLFKYDKNTGEASACLTHREIRKRRANLAQKKIGLHSNASTEPAFPTQQGSRA